MLKGILSVAVTAVVLIAAPIGAHADVLLDPAVVHIGTGFGTACDTGCAGDPNVITGTEFSVFLNGAGQPALSDPLIVIIGVPNTSSGTPTLTTVTFYDENAGLGSPVLFSSISPLPNSADGVLTAGDQNTTQNGVQNNAYEESGFNNTTNNSNNFTNWTLNGDQTATSFTLYAFRLDQSIDGQDLLDVTGSFPLGSRVIAYACDGAAGDALDGSCAGGSGNTYTTPFTESGFVAPEPTTQVLLGFALLGVGVLARRRRAI